MRARWVIPVDGDPIPDGALLIDARGRITAVGRAGEVPRPDDIPEEFFPDAALIPGLVNTHTHLELSGLESATERTDFSTWIRMVRELKARRGASEFLNAARRGIAECWAAGVTTVADTGDSGAVVEALAECDGSGIAYVEVFGPHPDQLDESLADLKARVTALRGHARGRVRIGVSPHAPYSVSGALYGAVAAWARAGGLPVAVHLAESDAECALLASNTGAFAEMWRRRGIPAPEPQGSTPVEWLARHRVLGPDTLCIHVVKAGERDIALLAEAGAAIAHCPLSNRAHGHGDAPLERFLAAGIRVGCGTDSVLSVGGLDLLAEVRAARRLAGLTADRAFRLCTSDAARAIGMGDDIGSLTAGKWGDVAVIGIPVHGDPVEGVLASRPADVQATCLSGRYVYRRAPRG